MESFSSPDPSSVSCSKMPEDGSKTLTGTSLPGWCENRHLLQNVFSVRVGIRAPQSSPSRALISLVYR